MAITFEYWRGGEPIGVIQPTGFAEHWRNGEMLPALYTSGGGSPDPEPIPAIINTPLSL